MVSHSGDDGGVLELGQELRSHPKDGVEVLEYGWLGAFPLAGCMS